MIRFLLLPTTESAKINFRNCDFFNTIRSIADSEPVSANLNSVSSKQIWILKNRDRRLSAKIREFQTRRAQDTVRSRNDRPLTPEGVGGISEKRKRPWETGLAGWGERIRTARCNFQICCESSSVPCRCHADLCILHGTSFGVPLITMNCEDLARPKRFELLTPRFVVWCSIQLSYGRGAF
jgi:hypothetical protein